MAQLGGAPDPLLMRVKDPFAHHAHSAGMTTQEDKVARLDRAAAAADSLAQAQLLAGEADRLRRPSAPERSPRPTLFPVFRN